MNLSSKLRAASRLLALAFLASSFWTPPRSAAQTTDGIEELTRGPVHEAFAESISYNPEPGIIIARQAPEPIEELPPEQKPAGANIAWIPGYWAWDEERPDFIWVSGVWRNVPPGRQWVPGYWAATDDNQWQWTSGYWAPLGQEETVYLPPPPESVENGPNIDAPSENHVWISGNWLYHEQRYVWSPGYWEPARENWIWIPARHYWTPRGYVYVDGYWDYDVGRRGMVFAPVHFDRAVYTRPDYFYTPVTVIALEVFTHHLFVRPHYRHYYFGDYYEPRYRDAGFFASFHYHRDRRGYDPFYVHERWRHRGDRDWDRRRREDFDFYRDHRDARPPRTLAALLSRPENQRRGPRDRFDLARPLDRVISDRSRQFEKTDRRELAGRTRELRDFSRERARLENRAGERRDGRDRTTVAREKFSRSPLAARIDQLRGEDAPPPRRETRAGDAPRQRPLPPGARDNHERRGPETPATRDRDPRPANPPMHPGANDRNTERDRRPENPPGRVNEREERPARPAAPSERRETPQRSRQQEPAPSRPQPPARPQAPERREVRPQENRRAEPRPQPQRPQRAEPRGGGKQPGGGGERGGGRKRGD